jgi:hypothetical protein
MKRGFCFKWLVKLSDKFIFRKDTKRVLRQEISRPIYLTVLIRKLTNIYFEAYI